MFVHVADMGKHCSRLARKNATVHATTVHIIVHESIEKVCVVKILCVTFSLLVFLSEAIKLLPSVKDNDS